MTGHRRFPCGSCGAWRLYWELVDGLCEDCDQASYERDREKWRVTDD